jgi:hypothetical protein
MKDHLGAAIRCNALIMRLACVKTIFKEPDAFHIALKLLWWRVFDIAHGSGVKSESSFQRFASVHKNVDAGAYEFIKEASAKLVKSGTQTLRQSGEHHHWVYH